MAIFKRKSKSAVAVKAKVKETGKDPQAILGIIRAVRITEKATNAHAQNKYSFLVASDANKPQVMQAVSERYGVRVRTVNMLNMSEKMRRRGRQIGYKSGFKKAIVTLTEGQTIDLQ